MHVDLDPTTHHVSSNEYVKLPQQETIKMGDQMKHKVILMKMVSTMSKLNLNSTMKKEVKTTL